MSAARTANEMIEDSIRPALQGDPRDVAEWALEALAEGFGLTDAEVGVIVRAIIEVFPPPPPPLPGERICIACGCSESRACPGGCIWATANLCSRCV